MLYESTFPGSATGTASTRDPWRDASCLLTRWASTGCSTWEKMEIWGIWGICWPWVRQKSSEKPLLIFVMLIFVTLDGEKLKRDHHVPNIWIN